jgi:hypothetical protein
MVYHLDCLAVSGVDLISTVVRIRSQNAVLLAAPDGSIQHDRFLKARTASRR